MPRLPKPLFLTLALVVLVALVLIVEILRAGGVFRSVDSVFAGSCRAIGLGGGSADMRIDRERGLAYLSLLVRDSGGAAMEGTVVLLDLNLAEPAPRAAMSYDPPDFRPQGLSLLKQPGRPAQMFAISASADGSYRVEIAEQDSHGAFVPRETVRDAAFSRPSAIAAAGARQFYVVNDAARSKWRERVDLLARSGNSTLVYYDGAAAHTLADDLAWPAGLALSVDGTRLYVAETLAHALRIYRRDVATGALTLERRITLDSAPASVDVDEDGMVWMTAHPRLLRFLAHSRDPKAPAPTQVLRVDPRQQDVAAIQVLADEGSQLAAGVAAARREQDLLIGARFDEKVLLCRPVQ